MSCLNYYFQVPDFHTDLPSCRVPVPIEAMRKVDGKLTFSPDLQGEIDKATRKVSLTLHSHGTSYCVPVGHSHFTKNELARNVEAIWKVLEKELPGGVQNIRAAYLKGLRTCAVPLYASLGVWLIIPCLCCIHSIVIHLSSSSNTCIH